MPSKEIIAANRVSEQQLLPHLRKGSSSSGSSVNVNASQTSQIAQLSTLKITAGENIGIGRAIAIGSDGKAYLSQLAVSSSRPASLISVKSANTNELLECLANGEAYVPDATFTVGAPVYMTNDGVISSTGPSISATIYIQQLGYAKDTKTLIIHIESPIIAK